MSLGHPIQLRLSPETQRACEEAAALQGKPFASYVRAELQRLGMDPWTLDDRVA